MIQPRRSRRSCTGLVAHPHDTSRKAARPSGRRRAASSKVQPFAMTSAAHRAAVNAISRRYTARFKGHSSGCSNDKGSRSPPCQSLRRWTGVTPAGFVRTTSADNPQAPARSTISRGVRSPPGLISIRRTSSRLPRLTVRFPSTESRPTAWPWHPAPSTSFSMGRTGACENALRRGSQAAPAGGPGERPRLDLEKPYCSGSPPSIPEPAAAPVVCCKALP